MSETKSTARRWAWALAGVLVLTGISVVGWRTWQNFQEIKRQNAELATKADQSAEAARLAAEEAGKASSRAEDAARQASEAEASRASAVDEKTQAEQARLQAEMAATEAGVRATTAQDEVARMQKEREAELDRMQQLLNRIVETRRTSSGLVMNLSDKALHFEFDSAGLSSQSRELLSRVAGILLASGGYGLAIHGHTDDVGNQSYNQGLSERRARAVKQYLVSAGMEQGVISVKGFGQSSPMVKGTSDAARAQNRRVEIVLTDTKIKFVGEAK